MGFSIELSYIILNNKKNCENCQIMGVGQTTAIREGNDGSYCGPWTVDNAWSPQGNYWVIGVAFTPSFFRA